MNHRHIEAFRAVMLTGTITAASRFLNISQPSVSRLMVDMEAHLKIRLFERRRGGRIAPTPEALRLMSEVERSFISLDRVINYAAEIGTFRHGQLTVAGMAALCLDVLPMTMAKWLSAYPDASAILHAYNSRQIVRGIVDQNYEVGFAEPPFDIKGVSGELLIYAPYVCAVPKTHRLARKTFVEEDDLRNEPKIILTNSRALHEQNMRPAQFFSFNRHTRVETTLSVVACRHVELGLGCALVDPYTAQNYRGDGVVFTRLQTYIPYIVGVLVPEGRSKSVMLKRFLDMFTEIVGSIALPGEAKVSIRPFSRQPMPIE